jgi:cytochrome b561
MLIVPLSGDSMVLLAGVFGMAVPKFLEKNESLANSFYDLHTILPYVLITFYRTAHSS